MGDAHRERQVLRLRDGIATTGVDRVATEEPLEIRLHGRPFAVIMRTPGADRELAAGFLLSEGVVRIADDLGTMAYCTDPSPLHPATSAPHHSAPVSSLRNVINVTLLGCAAADLDRVMHERRLVAGNASCGLCGRLTIESLQTRVATVTSELRVTRETMSAVPGLLRARQSGFDDTGGLHAACLVGADGILTTSAEDVGRHNAVDKVIGRMLMEDALPLSDRVLFVSGRTSFEIVQKAAIAGVPVVGAVSAPSSLAVELAEACGVTLLGFVRDGGFNVYTHAGRIT